MIQRWFRKNIEGDYYIWAIVLILSLWSIALVYSATGTMAFKAMKNPVLYLFKHSILVFFGLFLMWVVHRLDYIMFSKLSYLMLLVAIPLLLIAYKFGHSSGGASRWITIPLINQTFQPSDLAKLALISYLSAMLARRQKLKPEEYTWTIMVPMIFWCGAICGLIALSNFSTAAMLGATCVLVMFIGRVPSKFLLGLIFYCVILGGFGLVVGQRFGTFIGRIKRFWESFSGTGEIEYQAKQAYIAIAQGGILGRGAGRSEQRNFLPEPFSDFIYATLIEEYGLWGACLLLFLYLAFLFRGLKIVQNSSRAFGGLLAAGLTFSLVIQAMFHIAVNVGLVPITGQSLPMVSMGGTSMIFTCMSIGAILSVSRDNHNNLKA
jgi:cell division protein FtsW